MMLPAPDLKEPPQSSSEPRRIPGPELILFLVLFLFTACILILHFDFPPLPHNDFIQFAKPAQSWLEFRLPDYYKILPAFPLAIAGVSLLVPHDPTLLRSCEIVVLASGLTFLVFFWLLARRFLPRLWPVLMLFTVINPYFMEFSLQTLMVMLTGILMKRSAWLPMSLYLVLGACGLPLFHNGIAGPGVLLGPTGGYIIGFVVAGTLIGLAYEQKQRTVRICGLLAGEVVIYTAGVLWLAFSTGMTLLAALIVGFLPFIPGDVVKGTVAYILGERLEKKQSAGGN